MLFYVIFMLFVCSVTWLFFIRLSVPVSLIDCMERLVSEMTYDVLMGTLNPTHSLRTQVPNLRW